MIKIFEYEPKRNNRFLIEFPEVLPIESWMVHSIERPKYVNYIWEDIEIVFIDTINKSTSEALFKFIEYAEKHKESQSPLLVIYISMLDSTGVAVEKWEIGVKDLISIDFGFLDYGNDNIVKPKMILKPLYCRYMI